MGRKDDTQRLGAVTASEGTGNSCPSHSHGSQPVGFCTRPASSTRVLFCSWLPFLKHGTLALLERGSQTAHEHVTLITDNKQEFLNSIVLSRTENNERDTAPSFWISFSSNYDSKNILSYKWTVTAVLETLGFWQSAILNSWVGSGAQFIPSYI